MSELTQLDPPLTLEDFQPVDVQADPKLLRRLIDGLRALPNVSDMSVISVIAALDRLAELYELAEKRRDRILQMAEIIAKERSPQLEHMVRSGFMTTELLNEVMNLVSPPSPDCDCPRCREHFGKEPQAGNKPHLNS